MIVIFYMFWRNTVVRYANKNFRDHMKITDNVTIRGLLRRYERRFPRFFSFTKKTFIVCGITVLMLALIPGS
jgi:hypothetical protein